MAIIKGTNGPNTINGTSASDTIYGYGGHDIIYGNNGNDLIYGGAGDDDLFGGLGYNDLYGGSGADWFRMTGRSTGLSDDLIGDFEFGADKIDMRPWGVSDFSQILALLNNSADGATLNAFYNGYAHRITVDGVTAGQLISSDFLYNPGTAAKTVNGGNYADVLFGGRGADTLNGYAGNDILLGGIGNDDLFGGAHNDVLIGGAGWDWSTGGSGADIFRFRALSDSTPNANRDRITDFDLDVDRIDVSAIDADPFTGGNQAFEWRGLAAFDDVGQARYQQSGGSTLISFNVDTDAAPEMQIILTGNMALIRQDFIL
jgi:serralysin